MRFAALIVAAALVFTAGCPEDKYKIQMRIAENGNVERKVEYEVASTAGLNRSATNCTPENGLSEKESYGILLPADIEYEGLTNHGFLSVKSSPLGTSYKYIERMPGRTDLAKIAVEGREFVDLVIRALVAWVGEQEDLKADPERLARLQAFLNGAFREDALTAMLMGWQSFTRIATYQDISHWLDDSAAPSTLDEAGEGARFLQFLVERGYLKADAGFDIDEDCGQAIVDGVTRRAAKEMGYADDAPLPPSLTRLRDPQSSDAIWKEMLEAAGLREEEFEEYFDRFVDVGLFWRDMSGELVWTDAAEPTSTNGTWNEEAKAIEWGFEGRAGAMPPQVLYASWAKPDVEYQKQHLGGYELKGKSLGKFLVWRAGLSEGARLEWDGFVDGLTPESDTAAELKAFQFSPENAPQDIESIQMKSSGAPVGGARLILRATE